MQDRRERPKEIASQRSFSVMLSGVPHMIYPAPRSEKCMRERSGTTLVEQVVIMTLLGAMAAFAVVRIGAAMDALAVHGAAREIKDVFAAAREYAVAASVRTAVQIDPASARLSAFAGSDTVTVRELGTLHGVTLSATRDSMAYSPSGLGYGASNLSVIVQRHTAAETVTVSRLGRVR
jgi:Tfp pilus assembly protein FimT